MPRSVIGTVVSNKMMKSVTVAVTRLFQHTRVGKTVRETKKYMAHDELNACGPGDLVRLDESRPLSKHKRWVVTEILRRQRTFEHTPTPAPSCTTAAGQRTPAQ